LVKTELRRVPLLGFMFGRMGVFVDRKDPESRMAARIRLRALAREGISLCVFPEGTRNTSGEPLGRFYDGAFATAIDAGIPVLPLVLYGGPALMPNGQYWMRPGRLWARFLPPEPTAGLGPEDVEALKARVRQRMLAAVLEGPEGKASA
jgi:1-acyl-sn-glycerol-3-phosphate acyltransferase